MNTEDKKIEVKSLQYTKKIIVVAQMDRPRELRTESSKEIKDSIYAFDGYLCSGLSVSAVLTSHKDFDDLIYLLQVHKQCLLG